MEDNDTLIPDPAQIIRSVIKESHTETTEVNPGMNNDELWAQLNNTPSYKKALKPYLENRIEILKNMMEIDFNGKESAKEVGLRYLLCSGIAKELSDIIVKAEVSFKVINDIKKEQNASQNIQL